MNENFWYEYIVWGDFFFKSAKNGNYAMFIFSFPAAGRENIDAKLGSKIRNKGHLPHDYIKYYSTS